VNTGMEYEDILMRNQELMAIINRLTTERDEARRMYCRLHFSSTEMQHDFAKAKGWDCYKESDK